MGKESRGRTWAWQLRTVRRDRQAQSDAEYTILMENQEATEHNGWAETKDRSICRCQILLLLFQHWVAHKDTTSNSQRSLASSHLLRKIKSVLDIGRRVITSSEVSSSFRILHKLKEQSRDYIHQHMTAFICNWGKEIHFHSYIHIFEKETDQHPEELQCVSTKYLIKKNIERTLQWIRNMEWGFSCQWAWSRK